MCVLECLRRLKTSTRVKDTFLFKSCSFVNACVKEDDFFVRNISSEFYCRMIVICMFNEVVNLLFISVPQGKHIIDKRVSLPYQRFCISLLCTGLFVLWGGWGERKRKRTGHNGKGEREKGGLFLSSYSPGLVHFAIGLVNCVLYLPAEQVKFFGKFKLQQNCNQCCSLNFFGGAT